MAFQDNIMDFSFTRDIFTGLGIGEYVLIIGLIAISALAITRDTRHMIILVFPLALGWSRAGLNVPTWMILGAAMMSVITLIGAHNIGATLGGLQGAATKAFGVTNAGLKRRIQREKHTLSDKYTIKEATAGYQGALDLQGFTHRDTLRQARQPDNNKEFEKELDAIRSRL